MMLTKEGKEQIVMKKKRLNIIATEINIHETVTFGDDIDIICKGKFKVDAYGYIGDNCHIRANNVTIGKHFYNSGGLKVGGGGSQSPNANLYIGDRNTSHNNYINLAAPVMLGNDVGLSPEVTILTHGFWLSVLEGYPSYFSAITIGNNVWIGYRSTVHACVDDNIVVAAHSVVTNNGANNLNNHIIGGVPAKMIRKVLPISIEERRELLDKIVNGYKEVAGYHNVEIDDLAGSYPHIFFNGYVIDVELKTIVSPTGLEENEDTDDFRDYLRHYGIKIYTERPFKSRFKWSE